MFGNILVPTDLTENSMKALEVAIKMASHEASGLITLLHVIETIEDTDDEEFQVFYDKLMKRARKKMGEMADQFDKESVRIDYEILFGDRVREIMKFAGDKAIDLIILSSHRIDGIDSARGWATISYRVTILAPCPVLMVK